MYIYIYMTYPPYRFAKNCLIKVISDELEPHLEARPRTAAPGAQPPKKCCQDWIISTKAGVAVETELDGLDMDRWSETAGKCRQWILRDLRYLKEIWSLGKKWKRTQHLCHRRRFTQWRTTWMSSCWWIQGAGSCTRERSWLSGPWPDARMINCAIISCASAKTALALAFCLRMREMRRDDWGYSAFHQVMLLIFHGFWNFGCFFFLNSFRLVWPKVRLWTYLRGPEDEIEGSHQVVDAWYAMAFRSRGDKLGATLSPSEAMWSCGGSSWVCSVNGPLPRGAAFHGSVKSFWDIYIYVDI